MEIPIIVEPVPDNGFRASSGGLWGLETETPTREEAIEKLRKLIDGRLQAGAEVLGLEIRSRPRPLARTVERGNGRVPPGDRRSLGAPMSLHVLDTDTLVWFQEGHELVCRRVLSHPIDEFYLSPNRLLTDSRD